MVVVIMRAAGDAVQLVVAVVAGVQAVLAVLVGVILRRHTAAAAPVLVADPEVLELPRLAAAVALAQVAHRAFAVKGDILNPLRHLLHGAAAHVAADIRFAPQLLAQFHKLVRAEVVILDHAAPMGVDHRRALLIRANAVHPVILIGKTAAGPAQDRHLDFLQRLDHILANAVLVRDAGIFAHPVAFIDAASQMFGEVTVNIAVYFRPGGANIQYYFVHDFIHG